MKYIKDENLINRQYVDKYKQWLIDNQETYFSDRNNEATHWRDFCYWNKPCDREHLIMSNEVLLIDREIGGVHCFVICRIFGSPDNIKPRVKHIAKVIDIDELSRKHWRNGYFLLPDFSG